MRLFKNYKKIAGAVCAMALAMPSVSLLAQETKITERTETVQQKRWDVTQAEERNVRLNYVSASWSSVLADLAKKTGSTLVMHDAPPGRFSRQDWNRYDRKDAINILNRQLESKGFRILAKDQYLTIIQSRRSRAEYQRPVAPQEPGMEAQSAQANSGGQQYGPEAQPPKSFAERRNEMYRDRQQRIDQQRAEDQRLRQQMAANRQAVRSHGPQRISVDRPLPEPRHMRTHSIIPGQTTPPPRFVEHAGGQAEYGPQQHIIQRTGYQQPAEQTHAAMTIRPQYREALDLARQIHAAFDDRARLEDEGPNGLPAFVVDHFENDGAAPKRLFVCEIDTDLNELHITGPAAVQAGLRNLIRRIDVNPIAEQDVPTIVAGDGKLAEAGRKLQRPLSMISQTRKRNPGAATEIPGSNSLDGTQIAQAQPGGPGVTPGPMVPPMPMEQSSTAIAGRDADGLPGLLGNLKGDVTIEALDDLDILILRGNEKDVEAVMQVIQAVEQMAVGSLPEIHLLNIQHVDSQSLAQLLNDVYEQLGTLRSENAQQNATSVHVIPVVVPNAVLVLAPANSMQAILDLADELDQPIDPTHEVQVFKLRHAVATTITETLQEFYGDETVGLGTRLKIAADARTNSVIVQARPRDLSEISALIQKVDSDEAKAVNKLRMFPLKSALADELAEFLSSAIQSVGDPGASTVAQSSNFRGNTQNQEAKSTVLEFLAEDGQTLLRSGLLADIRFNSDPRTNTLMVTAPEASLPLIEELIKILDRPSESVAEIKVFELENTDAIDAVTMLEELFGDSETSSQDENRALGVELIGAQESVSSLIPLRFSVDSRSNSVVAIGGADALRIVEAVLFRLDMNETRTRRTEVIKLRNAPATDVADAINQFLQSQRELATIDQDRVSTSQLLEQEVIVTPEPISNNLMISATPAYFEDILALTRQLDAEPAQVIIQAMLVEVELDNTDEFGVELGFQDPVLFDRSLISSIETVTDTIFPQNPGDPTTSVTRVVSQEAVPGFNFNNQPLGNNPLGSPSHTGGQSLSNFALGRTNNDLGYGGLVLSASSNSVNVLIRALAARRNMRILSRPQILALDNQLAQIQVGQVVPVSDGVNITNNSVVPIITRDPAGIILTVTPRISPEGQIVMEVVAEKSVYTDIGVTVFTDTVNGNEVTSPIKNITTAQSTVKVGDGQTIVMGGMITKTDDDIERKVPWLGDLPIIGHAFRFDTHNHQRTELLIFLTPRIVHHASDFEMIKQVEAQRLHWFENEAEEVHGPIFGIPNESGYPVEGGMIDGGYQIDDQFNDGYPVELDANLPVTGDLAPQQINQRPTIQRPSIPEQAPIPRIETDPGFAPEGIITPQRNTEAGEME